MYLYSMRRKHCHAICQHNLFGETWLNIAGDSCNHTGMIVLREMAAAKINLYLHVTGKRADGFHELDSWVVFADIGDTLEVAKADTLSLVVEGPYVAGVPERDNSVLAAARVLIAAYGVTEGASITLHKRLPIAAGIGGGTADAAATLRLLVRLWNIKVTDAELQAIGATLGSDVPACLRASSLYMNGVGEQITLAPEIAGWEAVLVYPGTSLSTQEVFARFSQRFSSAMRHPKAFATVEAGTQFLQQAKNDLQPIATELRPVIGDVLAALEVQQGCLLSRMSGSGTTCYGIYNTKENAQNAALVLANAYPEWWVQETKLR
jgi:4-diphosphocytidyl-2-C-methyl-D-erythritol kinase